MTRSVHQLVAESFLGYVRCGMVMVVNHIDFNKTNNTLTNLEVVTQRKNANRKHINSSSKYTGVSWHKANRKWRAKIVWNNKSVHIGYFDIELDASDAYEKRLSEILLIKNHTK